MIFENKLKLVFRNMKQAMNFESRQIELQPPIKARMMRDENA